MPILNVEFVGEEIPTEAAQKIADAAAAEFGSNPGTLWVRTRALPPTQYAENGGELPPDLRPVFIEILLADPPNETDLARLSKNLTAAIGRALGMDPIHIHVIFEPPARGRIAFGGVLRS